MSMHRATFDRNIDSVTMVEDEFFRVELSHGPSFNVKDLSEVRIKPQTFVAHFVHPVYVRGRTSDGCIISTDRSVFRSRTEVVSLA